MSWQLKRNDTNETVDLPEDLQWVDEFGWSKISQSPPEYTITGSTVIQQGTKKAGRPITLGGDWAWVKRSAIEALQAWCDVPKLAMTLKHYNGQEFNVIWRLHEKAIEAEPVDYQSPETPDDPYTATFRLMTI